jgi:hypothetical protein
LLCDNLDQSDWDPGLVVSFDESEKIFAERFKNETNVDVLWCAMME